MDDKKKKEIGKRLKAVIDVLGMTQKQVSEEANISYSTLQKWVLGINCPTCSILYFLAQKGINVNWVLTGKGDIFLDG